jgi:hypothetical protein
MKPFFGRTRDRLHLRKLRKERKKLLARKPQWDDTRARVRWLNAQLALAVKNNDREEAERLMPLCIAVREEFNALLAFEDAENKRVLGIVSDPKEAERGIISRTDITHHVSHQRA